MKDRKNARKPAPKDTARFRVFVKPEVYKLVARFAKIEGKSVDCLASEIVNRAAAEGRLL